MTDKAPSHLPPTDRDFIPGPGDAVIWTPSGYVSFDDPVMTAEAMTLDTIATALSRIPRFGGHTSEFYSVAEHATWCALYADTIGLGPEDQRIALMHDAAEAFTGDMVSPLKRCCHTFRAIEAGVWSAIAIRFDLPHEIPEVIKEIDLVACATEKRDLLPGSPPWAGFPTPARYPVIPRGDQAFTRQFFLRLAGRLGLA